MMLALDAAEATLIERWLADGSLPHLQQLRRRGTWAPVTSTADWLVASPWPSFYTGQWPAEHGQVFYLQWRPELMRHDRPRDDWLPIVPFYRRFGRDGPRVIAIDMPFATPPTDFHGVEITCWATHEVIADRMTSYPANLTKWVRKHFGGRPITNEVYGPQRARSLLRLRDEMVRATALQADVGLALMQREPWELFLMAFGGTHRGGHKLWDRTGLRGRASDQQLREYDAALKEVYVATDTAVGRLVEAADRSDTTVVVCSLHGMGANTSRTHLLGEMLDRILTGEEREPDATAAKPGLLERLRQAVPIEWRSALKERLPMGIQDRLSMFWRGDDTTDWSRTPAFCLFSDLEGMIQINLKGRERDGVVEPGEEYERLMRQIIDGLRTFVDADTREAIISHFGRGDEIWPDAQRRVNLPDLLVHWVDRPAGAQRAIESPRHGRIDEPRPGVQLDGRSGHHRPTGWMITAGPGIASDSTAEAMSSFDLAAAIHERLGVEPPPEMRGRTPDLFQGSARP